MKTFEIVIVCSLSNSACSKQKHESILRPSWVVSSTESKQLMDQRSCSRVFTVAALQSPQLSLLPAVTSCCQNFSDAVTLDFFVIHSRSASFSPHLIAFALQTSHSGADPVLFFLRRSPFGAAFGCFVADCQSLDPSADVKTFQALRIRLI